MATGNFLLVYACIMNGPISDLSSVADAAVGTNDVVDEDHCKHMVQLIR